MLIQAHDGRRHRHNAGRICSLKSVVRFVSSGQGQATSDEHAMIYKRLLRIIDSVSPRLHASNGRQMAVKGPLNPPGMAFGVGRWAVQMIGGIVRG